MGKRKSNLGRLTAQAKRSRRYRSEETAEHRRDRLEYNRQRTSQRRAEETPDQRAARLKASRIRHRILRARQAEALRTKHRNNKTVLDNQAHESSIIIKTEENQSRQNIKTEPDQNQNPLQSVPVDNQEQLDMIEYYIPEPKPISIEIVSSREIPLQHIEELIQTVANSLARQPENFRMTNGNNLTVVDNNQIPESSIIIKTEENQSRQNIKTEPDQNQNPLQFVPVNNQVQLDIKDIKQEPNSYETESVLESASEALLQEDKDVIQTNEHIATTMFFITIADSVMKLPPELQGQAKLGCQKIVTQLQIQAKQTEAQINFK